MADTATITEYTITGMSCQHCVAAVTEALSAIAGVNGVRVDLAACQVSITSGGPVDDAAVRAAIDEAGYEVVG